MKNILSGKEEMPYKEIVRLCPVANAIDKLRYSNASDKFWDDVVVLYETQKLQQEKILFKYIEKYGTTGINFDV